MDGEVIQDDAHSFNNRYHDRARLKGALCEKIELLVAKSKSRMEGWKQVTEFYNAGLLMPEVYENEGKRSEAALRKWLKDYLKSGRDYMALMPKYQVGKGASITEFEEKVMLAGLLGKDADNCRTVGSVIARLKQHCHLVKIGEVPDTIEINGKAYQVISPSSAATLRRWADQFKRHHRGEWILKRHGEKALKDTFLPSILRDDSDIKPGDVWISDGHTLNFMVIDPDSGKPRRLNLIAFFDWASRMIVGATVDWTESTQAIADAFRNGVLYTGYTPKLVYVDNGKAYRSKYFGGISLARYEAQVTGIFARLGVELSFAIPYNARTKIIERYFETLNNQFEKWMPGYCGESIDKKPARMRRNEKLMQSYSVKDILTVEQAILALEGWNLKYYGLSYHRGIKARPMEVLESANIPPSRHISEERLNHCMLVSDDRIMNKEGVQLHGILYWDANMLDYVGNKLTLRYSIRDRRYVKVYNKRGDYIATARARDHVHAMVKLSDDALKDGKKLQKQIKEIKRHQRRIKESTAAIAEQTNSVPELIDPQNIKQLMQNPDPIPAPPEQVEKERENVTDISRLLQEINVEEADIERPQESEMERMIKTMGVKG